eukprot:1780078-Prymnesium_polylepis.2
MGSKSGAFKRTAFHADEYGDAQQLEVGVSSKAQSLLQEAAGGAAHWSRVDKDGGELNAHRVDANAEGLGKDNQPHLDPVLGRGGQLDVLVSLARVVAPVETELLGQRADATYHGAGVACHTDAVARGVDGAPPFTHERIELRPPRVDVDACLCIGMVV